MFQNLKNHIKILILILIFSVVAYLELQLHSYNLSIINPIVNISVSLFECLNLMLIGFFYFQTFKFHRLWRSYYLKKSFETQKYFSLIGVPFFQIILTKSFMRYANPRVYLKGRKREYIKILHEETKQSETSHLITILVTIPYQVNYFLMDKMMLFWSLTLFSIFFNVYPVLLQRMNRFIMEARFNKLIDSD